MATEKECLEDIQLCLESTFKLKELDALIHTVLTSAGGDRFGELHYSHILHSEEDEFPEIVVETEPIRGGSPNVNWMKITSYSSVNLKSSVQACVGLYLRMGMVENSCGWNETKIADFVLEDKEWRKLTMFDKWQRDLNTMAALTYMDAQKPQSVSDAYYYLDVWCAMHMNCSQAGDCLSWKLVNSYGQQRFGEDIFEGWD